jgi:hypothetical protein
MAYFPTSPLKLNTKLERLYPVGEERQVLIADEITLPENTPLKSMIYHRRKMSRFLTAECISSSVQYRAAANRKKKAGPRKKKRAGHPSKGTVQQKLYP